MKRQSLAFFVFTFLMIGVFISPVFALGPVADPFGSYPKCIQGDDGGKWLSWNLTYLNDTPPSWGSNRSIFRPRGDGTWEIVLRYSPGFTINQFKILYTTETTDTMNPSKWQWGTIEWQENFGNVRSWTIPSTASGSYVIEINWNDTPWAINAGSMFWIQPDSGALIINWKKQVQSGAGTFGDVDSADTNYNYGYLLFGSDTPGGPYTRVHSETFLVPTEYTHPTDATAMQYIETGLVNGDTRYYVVLAVDAYGLQSDTGTEASGSPAAWIDVYFRVEGIDFEKVKNSKNHIVYLTPYKGNKCYFFNKVPAKLAWGVPQPRKEM